MPIKPSIFVSITQLHSSHRAWTFTSNTRYSSLKRWADHYWEVTCNLQCFVEKFRTRIIKLTTTYFTLYSEIFFSELIYFWHQEIFNLRKIRNPTIYFCDQWLFSYKLAGDLQFGPRGGYEYCSWMQCWGNSTEFRDFFSSFSEQNVVHNFHWTKNREEEKIKK